MKAFMVFMFSLLVVACCPAIADVITVDQVLAETIAAGNTDTLESWLIYQCLALLDAYPWLIWPLVFLALCVPVLGPLANYTGNPKFNKAGIFINSFLQLITFGSSKNQPDVLSMAELTTNLPSAWPDLLRRKITAHQKKLEKELESVPLTAPDTKHYF